MLKKYKWLKVLAVTVVALIIFSTVAMACEVFTIGYWGNKNGQKTIESIPNVWGQLSGFLNLKDAEGNDFDPGNFTEFRAWLRGANASNMKYMLSAQLAAAELNYLNFFVAEPWTVMLNVDTRISPSGIISVQDLIGISNDLLNSNEDRELLGLYKDALDYFNNGMNIIP